MNIISIQDTMRYGGKWAIGDPSFKSSTEIYLQSYVVQQGEDMRIDLVMESIYGDDGARSFKHADILLYLNDIDNPLDIREGMILSYPPMESLDSYRFVPEEEDENRKDRVSLKQRLAVVNKTTRKDEKRKKFIDANYSLPPTVLKESRPGVVVTPNEILIGGI